MRCFMCLRTSNEAYECMLQALGCCRFLLIILTRRLQIDICCLPVTSCFWKLCWRPFLSNTLVQKCAGTCPHCSVPDLWPGFPWHSSPYPGDRVHHSLESSTCWWTYVWACLFEMGFSASWTGWCWSYGGHFFSDGVDNGWSKLKNMWEVLSRSMTASLWLQSVLSQIMLFMLDCILVVMLGVSLLYKQGYLIMVSLGVVAFQQDFLRSKSIYLKKKNYTLNPVLLREIRHKSIFTLLPAPLLFLRVLKPVISMTEWINACVNTYSRMQMRNTVTNTASLMVEGLFLELL